MSSLNKWCVAVVALVFCGCVSADTLQALQHDQEQLSREIQDLRADVRKLEAHIENESRRMWSQQLCRNGKTAEFIAEVQAGLPGTCSAGSLATALLFLNTLPYSTAIFRPGVETLRLPLSREGQLRDLLDPHNLHPSTRFLILVQPSHESDAAHAEALATGTKYLAAMRALVPAGKSLQVLGPHLLPCRLRNDVTRRYQGPMDNPVPGEPAEKSARIRVWAFRTDC
jgi:outer membrane murein-binding lipoprotein Lpp